MAPVRYTGGRSSRCGGLCRWSCGENLRDAPEFHQAPRCWSRLTLSQSHIRANGDQLHFIH
jgi:hypothetical protein